MSLGQASGPYPIAPRTATASGFGPEQGCSQAVDWVAVQINTTAVSGTTPSLTVNIQWSMDGGQTWADDQPVDAFTAITATGVAIARFTVKAPTFRLKETITGTTPSFTYTLTHYSR